MQGLFAPTYFAADEAQLYYELKGGQTLPFSCGAHKVHATNMKDILVMRMDENAEVKMININLADMSNAAEIRSLSLFLRYKLEVIEGRKNSLGAQILCETSVKEPGEAPPPSQSEQWIIFISSPRC